MSKLIVWGAGNRTKSCFERNLWNNNEIICIVDAEHHNEVIFDHLVVDPSEIKKNGEYDYVVVCNQFYFEIVPILCGMQVPLSKIIITDNVKEEPYRSCYERGKNIIPEIYNMNLQVIKQYIKTNERDLKDETSIYFHLDYQSNMEYLSDYYRYRTFEFVAELINENEIEGSLAEFGVFQGLFSSIISGKFPQKKIFLFDTFEGFESQEAEKEKKKGNCSDSFIESHKNTSIDLMLKNLPYPENAVVCQGLFPGSITDDAATEHFAFVSIDVDFEESTLEGLKFFYPRLSEGGYIFLHDYNTQYLHGVKAAVRRYEEILGYQLKKTPIADRAGTLIITK